MNKLLELFDTELIPNAKDVTRCTIENLIETHRQELGTIAEHIRSAAENGGQYTKILGISESDYPILQTILTDKGYKCEYNMSSSGRELQIRW